MKLDRLAFATFLAALLAAQPDADAGSLTRGVIEGSVEDSAGAVLPDVRVTLRGEAAGFEQAVLTDSGGRFRIEAPSGLYELTAEGDGFSVSRRRVELDESPVEVMLTLRPRGFAEEVTVIGARILGGPEAVRRIPGSFDVLPPESLEVSRVRDASEALRQVSGVGVREEEGFSL